jgi:hypothetical protein
MTPTNQTSIDITAAPRAVLRESVRLLYRVLGEERLGTARANAWEAICDDRRRAEDREHVARLLAAARSESRDHGLRSMIGGKSRT